MKLWPIAALALTLALATSVRAQSLEADATLQRSLLGLFAQSHAAGMVVAVVRGM